MNLEHIKKAQTFHLMYHQNKIPKNEIMNKIRNFFNELLKEYKKQSKTLWTTWPEFADVIINYNVDDIKTFFETL